MKQFMKTLRDFLIVFAVVEAMLQQAVLVEDIQLVELVVDLLLEEAVHRDLQALQESQVF